MRAFWWVWGLAGLVVVAGVLALRASPLPDGLDTTIARLKLPLHETAPNAPLPDYAVPGIRHSGVSTFIAAGIGLLMVFAVTYLIGRLLSRRSHSTPPEPETENAQHGTRLP